MLREDILVFDSGNTPLIQKMFFQQQYLSLQYYELFAFCFARMNLRYYGLTQGLQY